jgi:hypothetical protein
MTVELADVQIGIRGFEVRKARVSKCVVQGDWVGLQRKCFGSRYVDYEDLFARGTRAQHLGSFAE